MDALASPTLVRGVEDTEQTFLKFLNRGEKPNDFERQLLADHFDRITSIFSGGNPPPYELEIQPSGKCNLDCTHCFGKHYPHLENRLDESTLDTIVENVLGFRQNGFEVETVKFCGTTGEPLTNPITLQGIRRFKEAGKKVILFTNGLNLGKNNCSGKYYDYVLGADKLNLSLDAGSERTFMQIKGKPGFDQIVTTLEETVAKREAVGSRTRIIVSYVIGTGNYHEVAETARRMKEIGVDEAKFRVDFTDQKGIHGISGEIIAELHAAKKHETPQFKVDSVYSEEDITEDDSAFNSEGRRCFNSNFWACIGPDCNLYSCGHRTHGGIVSYGDALKHDLNYLWNHPQRLDAVSTLPDANCSVCSPSSSRRNTFMTFLSGLPLSKIVELNKKYGTK